MANSSKLKRSVLRLNVLPKPTADAFSFLSKMPLFKKSGWYLAGGTALAMQTGHRRSVDLDFFTTHKEFDELQVETDLQNTGEWKTTYREKGTIYGEFKGAKISLIAYPFFVPSKKKIQHGTIKILLSDDIASMKIIAISQRGRKRDFYDLYWYCANEEPLYNIILRSIDKYPGQENNVNHIIKSLSYFADAENDPEPKIFFTADWREVKKFFTDEAKNLMRFFRLI